MKKANLQPVMITCEVVSLLHTVRVQTQLTISVMDDLVSSSFQSFRQAHVYRDYLLKILDHHHYSLAMKNCLHLRDVSVVYQKWGKPDLLLHSPQSRL